MYKNENLTTKNYDINSRYFELVQDKIKELISEDKEIKPDEVELFNREIFNQNDQILTQIKEFIDKSSMGNLDINRVAKTIYDRFKLQIKNNIFNKDDVNDVPNKLLGENKLINKFDNYVNDIYKLYHF